MKLKNQPLVSVIMNCYNGENYLTEAIESVLNQTYKNLELIFWDNVSTDKSQSIVESYNDDRIKYYLADKHTPLGEARNCALKKVKGAFIAFLDVDDLWVSEKLEKLLPLFNASKVGLVYSLADNINSSGKTISKPQIDKDKKERKITFVELLESYNVVFSSAIISRKALIFVGGYFDNILKHAEEYDLFLRIGINFKIIRLNVVLAKYRIHQNQDTLKNFGLSIYEEKYIISKLRLLHPNIFENNEEMLRIKDKNSAWQNYLNCILKKNTRMARKKLFPYIFESYKYFVFYLLSYVGGKIIISLWNKERKKKGKSPVIS